MKKFIEEDMVLYPLNELCKRIANLSLSDIDFSNLSALNTTFIDEWSVFENILDNYNDNDSSESLTKIGSNILDMFSSLGIETNKDETEDILVNELDLVKEVSRDKWTSKDERKKAEKTFEEIVPETDIKESFLESDVNELIAFLLNKNFWTHYFTVTKKTYDYTEWDNWIKKNKINNSDDLEQPESENVVRSGFVQMGNFHRNGIYGLQTQKSSISVEANGDLFMKGQPKEIKIKPIH